MVTARAAETSRSARLPCRNRCARGAPCDGARPESPSPGRGVRAAGPAARRAERSRPGGARGGRLKSRQVSCPWRWDFREEQNAEGAGCLALPLRIAGGSGVLPGAGWRPRGACELRSPADRACSQACEPCATAWSPGARSGVPFPSSEGELAVEPLREDGRLAGTVRLISAKARVSLPARGPFAQPRNAEGRGLHSYLVSSPKRPLSSSSPQVPAHTSQ